MKGDSKMIPINGKYVTEDLIIPFQFQYDFHRPRNLL